MVDEVKERVFYGGLDFDDGVCKEVWLFLFGVYDWYSIVDECKVQVVLFRDVYIKLKGSWWECQIDQGGEGEDGEWWREQWVRIEKDVYCIDCNVLIFVGEDIFYFDLEFFFVEVGINVYME